ncbi:hypothetical protein V494_05101 [Pseudogymnoascus sp. VKM F-4513 (FW-928)]|nr:hypothetical protein V494_05101 [Pseudogymnoascus sp. VKM F-4513 (FW-928)]
MSGRKPGETYKNGPSETETETETAVLDYLDLRHGTETRNRSRSLISHTPLLEPAYNATLLDDDVATSRTDDDEVLLLRGLAALTLPPSRAKHLVAHNNPASASIDGPSPTAPSSVPTPEEDARRRSDSDRIAPIVASISGRAKWGLQASSRRSAALLREERRRGVVEGVVVRDEEVVEVEVGEHVCVVVAGAVVVVRVLVVDGLGLRSVEMSEVQSEAVGDGEDVVKERRLRGRGGSIRVVVSEIRVGRSARGVQGRCAADGHCRSHNTAAECCVTSGARALDSSAPVAETGRMEGEREAGLTV